MPANKHKQCIWCQKTRLYIQNNANLVQMTGFDYRDPDYAAVFADRSERLKRMRADPRLFAAARMHYRTAPWDFIRDWGMTFEPRNIERGLISSMPFIPWQRQVEFLKWMYARWQSQERGLVEKSRDCGVTWLAVGFAVSQMLFEPGFTTGFGSRKEDLVDKIGDSKSIFEKLRFFLASIPVEFLPVGWSWKDCSAYMRIVNPDTGAAIIGEAGDNIGRGGRTSIYLVDEAAFVEHQDLVDAALSQNTNCQIDISTVNGSGNAFYQKRQRYPDQRVFIFDWREDPRKDQSWYDRQKRDLDPRIVAQEIDRDYNASNDDAFIPAAWVAAAIDAHIKLGFIASGIRATGFDPADVGDSKAVTNRHGSIIQDCDQLSEGDITQAMPWAFSVADQFRADVLKFDGDGMGAPVMKMTLATMGAGRMKVQPYHGSGSVEQPDAPADGFSAEDGIKKTNSDTYANYRAQTWSALRARFHETWVAVNRAANGQLVNIDPDKLISISSKCKCLTQLQAELSRPKRVFTANGKILVEAKRDMKKRGVQSPNLADAAVMAFSAQPEAVSKAANQRMFTRSIRDHMRV